MNFDVGSTFDPQIVHIDWNEDWRIGPLLSGGLDSAVLLATILFTARKKNKKLKVQPFSIIKSDGSSNYVPKILDYLSARYDFKIPPTFTVGDGSLHHTQTGQSAITEIFEKNLCDQIFFGTNKIPPQELPGLAPKRREGTHPRIQAPFFSLYKTHVLDLCIQLGDEKLFELTHTCTEQTTGNCRQCWQCHERAWAFEQLGIRDPQL